MSASTLIVGASQAGMQLAVSLRALDPDAPITLLGAEPHPPYQRPPLSKDVLSGKAQATSATLRSDEFYADQRIDLVCGERVVSLDLDGMGTPGSGTAETDSGRRLRFDRLALTVGARARRLTVPGETLDGVCYLRDMDDALSLQARLASANDVVVIGGGFIGLEVAAVARSQGKSVTVLEATDRLVGRAVAPPISQFYESAHTRRGTAVRLGASVTGIDGQNGRARGVLLDDGAVLPADLVVVGIGVVPRTELAEQLGLRCAGGIVVDDYARTSDPSVVAAGDCTVMPNPVTGDGFVRLESLPNATSQARVAAATLAGQPQRYSDVPWFWSDQFDLKLQMAGLSHGYADCVVRGDPASEKFSVLYYGPDGLLAGHSVNRPADYVAVRKALAEGIAIPADRAADPDLPLKDLIRKPAAVG
jgi:3-phenylpropionate/trans-cinnamate dioxygenase ferredoxin reductase component